MSAFKSEDHSDVGGGGSRSCAASAWRRTSGPSMEKAKLGPPPRWLKCPRKGKVIAGKFLPLKTPLCSLYDSQVPERYRFYPRMVVFAEEAKNVGLWLDLTNTDRFYDPKEVEAEGATYRKFNCKGHGECPSLEQTNEFIRTCQLFWASSLANKKKLIVHCTHGFNRTGFLICAYLVQVMNWSVDAAVREYASARPPGIYKGDYLRELFIRFEGEDESFVVQPPPLPDWCDESEPVLNDDEAETSTNGLDGGGKKKKRRENASDKPDPVFMDGKVSGVVFVADAVLRAKLQRKVQEICQKVAKKDRKMGGFPGSQPVSLTLENLRFLVERRYKVSWKADGVRALILVDGPGKVYMFDRDNSPFSVSSLTFPHARSSEAQRRFVENTLLDAEMIIDEVKGASVPRLLIYDIIQINLRREHDTARRSYRNMQTDRVLATLPPNATIRLGCIREEIIIPRQKAMSNGDLDRSKEAFSVRLKEFWPTEQVEKNKMTPIHNCRFVRLAPFCQFQIFGEKFQKQLSHEIDGLIFQPCDDQYEPGRCESVLKWKPPEQNSIDFKLKIRKEQRPGMLAEWIGYLYVLHSDQPFTIMKATKTLQQYDNKIIECKFDSESRTWKFMRERTDKSFPNAFATAQGVLSSIVNPVTKELLFDAIKQGEERQKQIFEGQQKQKEKTGQSDKMPPPTHLPPKKRHISAQNDS